MSAIWALADLHLSFGVPDKKMDVFGENWRDHPEKIASHWKALVSEEDLVLIPGDISWAKHLEEAAADLEWIDALPGTKLILRGNHDYWWSSVSKVEKALPPSLHLIQNNTFKWGDAAIGGARLWDTPEYNFGAFFPKKEPECVVHPTEEEANPEHIEKLFNRELLRLERSLEQLDPDANMRIAMTHYPPVGADLAPSRASALLEKYNVSLCVFGHLHNIAPETPLFGEARGVRYILAAADYINFTPVRLN